VARQLADLKADVIVTYATPGVLAAKSATTTIPIVMTVVADALASRLVSSLARPGGNVTGMTYFVPELAAKRLELLKEANAGLTRVGVLFNPDNPSKEPVLSAMKQTADALKIKLAEFPVREAADLDGAFAAMAAKPVGSRGQSADREGDWHRRADIAAAPRRRGDRVTFD